MGGKTGQVGLGAMLAVAALWVAVGVVEVALLPLSVAVFPATAVGAKPNPCGGKTAKPNPCGGKTSKPNPCNPCNPCGGKSAKGNPCNPCNPCGGKSAKGNPCNPCNPCGGKSAKGNPCNPCNPRGTSSDNPCNPRGAGSDNPCNPCAGGGKIVAGGKLDWGEDFRGYRRVSSPSLSKEHGNRLMVAYVSSKAAERIFLHNARLAKAGKRKGFRNYPPGTIVVGESWDRNVRGEPGKPGKPGPVFLMRKEKAGYDPAGNDWRYVFAKPDFTRVREGRDGPVAYCKICHQGSAEGDYIHPPAR